MRKHQLPPNDMTIHVTIQTEVDLIGIDTDQLKTAVYMTLHQEEVTEPTELTLALTDNNQIQQLNHAYRGVNKPTDVLSFPAGDVMPDTQLTYLGDIVIAIPYAQQQADNAGHTLMAELCLLTIHGVLHLLGYDHTDLTEKQLMWQAQTAVLTQMGFAHIMPTESY